MDADGLLSVTGAGPLSLGLDGAPLLNLTALTAGDGSVLSSLLSSAGSAAGAPLVLGVNGTPALSVFPNGALAPAADSIAIGGIASDDLDLTGANVLLDPLATVYEEPLTSVVAIGAGAGVGAVGGAGVDNSIVLGAGATVTASNTAQVGNDAMEDVIMGPGFVAGITDVVDVAAFEAAADPAGATPATLLSVGALNGIVFPSNMYVLDPSTAVDPADPLTVNDMQTALLNVGTVTLVEPIGGLTGTVNIQAAINALITAVNAL